MKASQFDILAHLYTLECRKVLGINSATSFIRLIYIKIEEQSRGIVASKTSVIFSDILNPLSFKKSVSAPGLFLYPFLCLSHMYQVNYLPFTTWPTFHQNMKIGHSRQRKLLKIALLFFLSVSASGSSQFSSLCCNLFTDSCILFTFI